MRTGIEELNQIRARRNWNMSHAQHELEPRVPGGFSIRRLATLLRGGETVDRRLSELEQRVAVRVRRYSRTQSVLRPSAFTSCLLMLTLLVQIVAPSIHALDKPSASRSDSFSNYRRLATAPRRKQQGFNPQEAVVEAAVVRRLGSLNGRIEGTVRQLIAEDVTLNGSATITSALLMPGTPTVQLNGTPTFGGTVQGTGSATPSNHRVTLNGGVTLGRLVNRVDAIPMPTVAAPPASTGTRDVVLNNAGNSAGDFATVRDLTLNGNVGNIAVPPGTYRTFTANGNNSFTFGVADSTEPTVYNLSELRLNGTARLQLAGPVIVTLASGGSMNGAVGSSSNPLWLTLKIASGGLTLNGSVSLYGVVQAPSGTVVINGNSLLQGTVAADRLTINGNGTLKGTAGVLTSVNPATAVQGQTLTVTLRGVSTHWLNGSTRASFGGEIAVGGAAEGEFGPIQVLDSFTAAASIVVSSTAALAPRTVKVLTPVSSFDEGAVEVLIDAFTVTATARPGAATAAVSTLAGNGNAGFANGSATQAQFRSPAGVAAGPGDSLFVADSGNHSIRTVASDGSVTTLAGNGSSGFADATGAAARFNNPQGVDVDASGAVIVADTGNNRIRRIASDGTVTTIAGTGVSGLQNGSAAQARFNAPQGVAVDNAGGVYIADTGNNVVRYLAPNGDVSTIAGDGTIGSSDAPARFSNPVGVAYDGATLFVYLGDTGNHRIRRVTPSGNVVTIAGGERGFRDGTGAQSRFADPAGVAIDGAGKLIIADSTNSLLRMVDATKAISGAPQAVTTIAGTGARGLQNGAGDLARFFTPRGVSVTSSSAMIVADTGNNVLRKITLPPSITALNPAQSQPGQTIAIEGERFDARSVTNNVVMFARSLQAGGGQSQAHVLNVTRTQLTVAVPMDAATGNVTVQTEGGTAVSPSVFTVVVPPPTIADFNPKSGIVGSQVTIVGTNLTDGSGNPAVTFAGANGARLPALVNATSDTQLTVTVPNGAVTGFIQVTNNNGSAITGQPFTVEGGPLDYQLTLAPTVSSAVQHTSAVYIVYATGSSSTFSQLISLSISGMPAGVQATFEPAQVSAGAQSTLTLDLSNAGVSPGSIPFTIHGSALVDGSAMLRTVNGSLTVVAAGQTTLSGRVLSTENEPIMGATVSLDGKTATTDAAGGFLLSGVSAGVDRAVMIDGRTASAPNRTYPIIVEPATVVAGQANIVPFTFFLPAIDTQFEVTVVPNQDTVVTTPRVPGIIATIPAGANLRNRDGSPVTRVSITPVPIDRTPAPVPPNVLPSMVFTIQPGGALSDIPVPVTYPNLSGADAGVRVELYAFDHDLVKWYIYGYGRVSSDARRIEPEIDPATGRPYGLTTFSWYFTNPPAPNTPFSNRPIANNGNPAEKDCGNKTGNPVDLSSGVKLEPMIDVAFGGARGGIEFGRVYSTDLARAGIVGRFGLGIRDTFDITLVGTFEQSGSGRMVTPEQIQGRMFSYLSKDADGTLNFTTTATTSQLGDVLKKLPDGTFTYRYMDGEIIRFDDTGRVTSLVDPNGNTTTLTYSGSDLTRITDPVGRFITLEYSQDRISRVTDSFGRSWHYTYNTRGQVATVTDPLNQVLRYTYIIQTGFLSQVIDKRGVLVKSLTYDADSRLSRQTMAGGMSITYTYTLSGDLVTGVTMTDSLGRREKRRFNANGLTIEEEDALGQVSRIERDLTTQLPVASFGPCGCGEATRTFDDRGNVTSVTNRLGQTTRMEYEPVFNHVTKITDQLGRVTRMGYDSRGNLTSITDPLNQISRMTYDQHGQLTSMTDALGHTRRYEYDAQGNITAVVNPLNNRVTMEYDNIGRVTAVVDALNRRSTMTYDALGHLLTVTDHAGATTTMDYDANGNVRKTTKANGNNVLKGFDAANRVVSLTDGLGNIATIEYDNEDQITATVTPLGRRTTYTYDNRGQVTTITDPVLGVSRFSYDNRGNLLSSQDQRGHTTTYHYDELYRLVSMRDPLARESRVSYDAVGNIIESVDRLNRHVTKRYDALNRLTSATYADATVSYEYDAASRRTEVDDSQGGVITWTYDDADRLLSETSPAGVVSYAYNAADQVTQMTGADRAPVRYAYDDAGRLETITQGPETFTYAYDLISRVVSLQRPNGVTTFFDYDDNSRLSHMLHQNEGGALEEFFYTYTPDGEIETISSLNGVPLLPEVADASPANAANRVGQFGGTSYTFDAVGQTTLKTDATGRTTYNWDARGRMTSASLPDGQSVSYSYDARGRRASRTANGSTTTFLYDGLDVVLDRNENGSTVDYLNGLGIDVKLRQRASTAGAPDYFLQDHLGSTIALTDSTGNVSERQSYESFGGSPGSALTRYGYTGRERDDATGLLFYRARWYDSQQGRFISEDPIGGMNRYLYAGNNPIKNIDPLGTSFSTFMDGFKEGLLFGALSSFTITFILAAIGATGGIPGAIILGITLGALAVEVYKLWDELSNSDICGDVKDQMLGQFLGGLIGGVLGGMGGLNLGARVRARFNIKTPPDNPEGSCFAAGTKVATPNGEKKIEEIRAGDEILSADPEGGAPVRETVTQVYERESAVLLEIRVANETINVTPEHPFWVVDQGWVAAGQLNRGSPLLTRDGSVLRVDSVTRHEGSFRVYNLEVATAHTYHVSSLGILVHNVYERKQTGAYEIEFESGKTYGGKGSEDRMLDSVRRLEDLHGDKAAKATHYPTATERDAFILEDIIIERNGGLQSEGNPNTYNQINSPGRRYRGR